MVCAKSQGGFLLFIIGRKLTNTTKATIDAQKTTQGFSSCMRIFQKHRKTTIKKSWRSPFHQSRFFMFGFHFTFSLTSLTWANVTFFLRPEPNSTNHEPNGSSCNLPVFVRWLMRFFSHLQLIDWLIPSSSFFSSLSHGKFTGEIHTEISPPSLGYRLKIDWATEKHCWHSNTKDLSRVESIHPLQLYDGSPKRNHYRQRR